MSPRPKMGLRYRTMSGGGPQKQKWSEWTGSGSVPGHSRLVRVVGSCEHVHVPSVLAVADESQSPGEGVGHSAASEQKPEGAEGDLRTPAPAGGQRGGTECWLRGDWPDF